MPNSHVAVMHPQTSAGSEYSNADELLAVITQGKVIRSEVCKTLRCSASTLSQYLNKKYVKGRPDLLNAQVADYLKHFAEEEKYAPTRQDNLILTEQVRVGLEVIEFAVRHRGFVILAGESGTGKTSSLLWYARKHPKTIYLQLSSDEGYPRGFMEYLFEHLPKLLKAYDGEAWRKERTFRLRRQAERYLHGGREVLLIDEANNLKASGLEYVRSIQMATGIPVVLSGTSKLDDILGYRTSPRYRRVNEQLHRRIEKRKSLPPLIAREDVAGLTSLFGPTSEGAIDELHQWCNLPGKRYGWLNTVLVECKYALLDTGQTTISLPLVQAVIGELGI